MRGVLWQQRLDDLARQQHATCLAADEPGSHHAVAHIEIVFGLEEPLHHLAHAQVFGHHHVAHLCAGVGIDGTRFQCKFCMHEEAVPTVDVALGGIGLLLVHTRIETRSTQAVGKRLERTRYGVVKVWHEHGGGVTLPYLQRMHEQPAAFIRADVDKQLRRVADLRDGFERMPAAQHGEEGHRI